MVVLRPNGKTQERNPRLGDYTNTLDYYTLTAQPEFQFYHTSIPQFDWDFSVCNFFWLLGSGDDSGMWLLLQCSVEKVGFWYLVALGLIRWINTIFDSLTLDDSFFSKD